METKFYYTICLVGQTKLKYLKLTIVVRRIIYYNLFIYYLY